MFALAALPVYAVLALAAAPVPSSKSPVVSQTLASGAHLIVSPHPTASLVAIEIRVRGTGSANETPEENGLSHAVEHMVFKGTADQLPGAFDEAFERMGGEASAQTGRDATAYRVTVLPDKWRDALKQLGVMLHHPAFRDDDWTRERQVIESEMRVALSDPTRTGLQLLSGVAYPDNDPYRQPLMGTAANVARFSADDLRTFHQKHYQSADITVVIAGAVTPNEARAAVETTFPADGTVPAVSQPVTTSVPPAVLLDTVVRAPLLPADALTESRLATLVLGFSAPRLQTDPQGAAAGDVLAAFLARSGTNGVLGRRLISDKTMNALTVRAEYLPNAHGAWFVIHASGERRDIGRIEDALCAELESVAVRIAAGNDKNGSLADELTAAIGTVASTALYDRGTMTGDAEVLARYDVLGAPPGYEAQYLQAVRTVSLADMERLLTHYVVPGKRAVAVVGIAPKPEPIL